MIRQMVSRKLLKKSTPLPTDSFTYKPTSELAGSSLFLKCISYSSPDWHNLPFSWIDDLPTFSALKQFIELGAIIINPPLYYSTDFVLALISQFGKLHSGNV